MEEMEDGRGRLLMRDISHHWRFNKPDSGLVPTEDFASDLPIIDEALQEPHDELESDEDAVQPLSNIDEIIRDMDRNNNNLHRSTPEAPDAADEELLNSDGVDMLDVNSPRIIKSKGRPTGAKNKKGIMTRAAKAKAKSTRRDPSGFEHVDARIRTTRGGKGGGGASRRGKDKGGAAASTITTAVANARSKRVRKQLKEFAPFTAATFDADMQAIQAEDAIIEKDIRAIISRQAARQAAEASAAVATTKGSIHIDSDAEFDVNGDGDAASADDWMYDWGP